MNDINILLINRFIVLILVTVRMTALFVITPVFGRRNIPGIMKVGLALFCAMILVPLMANVKIEYTNLLDFAMIALKEFLVGIILGYVSFLVFSALYVAGQIIDMQIGFGMVNLLDPMMQESQVPLMGNFIYILTTVFFLMIDGHHILLTALFKSYNIIPINGFVYTDALFNNIVVIFREVFVIGFKISMPVLAAALLSEVALGILSRTVPQMNVFVVGIPLKLAIGIATLLVMMPLFIKMMGVTFDRMYSYIYLILKSMGKG